MPSARSAASTRLGRTGCGSAKGGPKWASRAERAAVTMAEEPERPACLGMLVVYDRRKPRGGSGVPAAAQCL